MIDKETLNALREISKQLGGAELIEIENSGAELERLKTTCLAQEAEIARLQAGFDELKEHIRINMFIHEDYDAHNRANNQALRSVLKEINRITGVKE